LPECPRQFPWVWLLAGSLAGGSRTGWQAGLLLGWPAMAAKACKPKFPSKSPKQSSNTCNISDLDYAESRCQDPDQNHHPDNSKIKAKVKVKNQCKTHFEPKKEMDHKQAKDDSNEETNHKHN
jgi:hypothetical protein